VELTDELSSLEGVKYVKHQSDNLLRIELFSREIPGTEAEDIPADLRSLSQQVSNTLNQASTQGDIKRWNWVEKPEKQYQDRSHRGVKVSDRQSAGHKPAHYTISIQRKDRINQD